MIFNFFLTFALCTFAAIVPQQKITQDEVISETAQAIAETATTAILFSLANNLTLPLNYTGIQLGSILFPDPYAFGGLALALGDQINQFETKLVNDLRPSLEQTLASAAQKHLDNHVEGGYTDEELHDIHDAIVKIIVY
jgi:hypothetical protein